MQQRLLRCFKGDEAGEAGGGAEELGGAFWGVEGERELVKEAAEHRARRQICLVA